MMKRLFTIWAVLSLWGYASFAQAMSDGVFRARMDSIVSLGNRYYENSNRDGIMAMYDTLRRSLSQRSHAGLLNRIDSLEYTADGCKLLGDWYYENSFYKDAGTACVQAEEQFKQALQIFQENDYLGEGLDRTPMIWRELAQLYYRMDRYQDALDCISSAERKYASSFGNLFIPGDPAYFDWLDMRMQQALCLARLGRSDESLKKADEVLTLLPANSVLYYESLRKKAKIILLSKDDERNNRALPLYKSYFQNKKAEALSLMTGYTPEQRQDYWMRMRPFLTDCYLLEGEDPGFLFDVSLFSKGLLLQLNLFDKDPKTLKTLSYTWMDVQKSLPDGACAMECIQYEKDGKKKLGAVVVKKTGDPVWVTLLDPVSFMDFKVGGLRVSDILRQGSSSPANLNRLYLNDDLKHLLWPDALLEVLGPCEKLFFSPDGYQHQVAIEYMLPQGMQEKQLYRLSSSRQIIIKRPIKLDSALVCGGIDYYARLENQLAGNDSLAHVIWKGKTFHDLSHSREEAKIIYDCRKNRKDTLILGGKATEAAIRELMGQYSLVHLATHGGFRESMTPNGTDLKPCMSDNSMSESVIVLSGANRIMLDAQYNPNCLDGILSAYELSSLDMTKTSLAVISACQTSMGYITSDGVYGIQRGLKNAGAGGLILSLWCVSDAGTKIQMTRFYENMLSGMDVHEAFNAARDQWETDPQSAQLNKPHIKDAFILIDVF